MKCPFQSKEFVYNASTVKTEWQLRGSDKCCSYCGSWHPQEFLEFLPNVTSDPNIKVRIELNDKRNKIYVSRPDVNNASEGAIKVYLAHIKEYVERSGFDVSEIDNQLHHAFEVSQEKAIIHADEIMEDLKSNNQ